MKRMLFSLLMLLSSPMLLHAGSFVFPKEPLVRVRIIHTLDSMAIFFNGHWIARDSSDGLKKNFRAPDSIVIIKSKTGLFIKQQGRQKSRSSKILYLRARDPDASLVIRDVPYGLGWWWQGKETRSYQGDIEIRINDEQKLDVVATLPLERYICGVIPYEIGENAPAEALKAQAVAARSEALSALVSGKYRGPHYDLCADVECQVYGGNNKRTAQTDSAVAATKGQCLFFKDNLIGAYYASNCGGVSENIENIWPQRAGPLPVWRSRVDADGQDNPDLSTEERVKAWILGSPRVYCNPRFYSALPEWSQRNFRWQVEVSAREISENLNKIKPIGELIKIIPLARGKSGRLIRAAFLGTADTLVLNSELQIRKIRKPPLRSSCFFWEVKKINPDSTRYLFRGAGWGHGVGLCQSGAMARAMSGQGYKKILKHYFTGVTIQTAYPLVK